MTKNNPICVSVINMKGGVGKTTFTALLSQYASSPHDLDLNVLAVDLDPQANLSQALLGGIRYQRIVEDQAPSIVDLFRGYHPPTSGATSPEPLDFSTVPLEAARGNLRVIPSRFDFSDNLIDSLKPDPKVLARCISEHYQDADIIFIDCAPTESIFTQAAYHASRYILVPVKPEYFATIGFPLLNESLESFRSKNLGHKIDVIGVAINNSSYHFSGNRGGPERERGLEDIFQEAEKNRWKVFETQLPLSRGFPKMMRGERGRLGDAPWAFNKFAREFFQSLGFSSED